MRDAEDQHHEDRRERDDERKDDTDQDHGSGRLLASGGKLADPRCFLCRRVDRVPNEALVLILLHVPTIASKAACVCTASAKLHYTPAGIRGLRSAPG